VSSLTVEIVSPEAALWSGPATALMARSSEGEFTILPQHTATVGDLVGGVVRVATDEGEIAFVVHSGYFQVSGSLANGETLATVLASVAEPVAAIDVARAQAAKESAEAELANLAKAEADPVGYEAARAKLERAELRLSAASR